MRICVHYFQLKVQPNEELDEDKSVMFSSASKLALQSITLGISLHAGKAMVTSGGINARTENNNTITHLSQLWVGGGGKGEHGSGRAEMRHRTKLCRAFVFCLASAWAG